MASSSALLKQRQASTAGPKAHGAQLNNWEWRTPPETQKTPARGGVTSVGELLITALPSLSYFLNCVGKAIVRRSAGIWQRGGLESSPMLAPIQPASFPRALEVSLSRALNGFTKLITSFSAFLKEPKATQVQTSRGSPLSR